MWNGTGDLSLMMFAGKEVGMLTILYKKHSLAIFVAEIRMEILVKVEGGI